MATHLSFSASMRGQALAVPLRRNVATVAAVQVQAKQNSLRRQRRSEKQREVNRRTKSAVATRMKKVLRALDTFQAEPPKSEADLEPVEKLISEAFSEIDRAKSKKVLHKNTAARRKSLLSRAKSRLMISAGLYTPEKTVVFKSTSGTPTT